MASSFIPFARPVSIAAPRVVHADHDATTSNFIQVARPPKRRATGEAGVVVNSDAMQALPAPW